MRIVILTPSGTASNSDIDTIEQQLAALGLRNQDVAVQLRAEARVPRAWWLLIDGGIESDNTPAA